MRWAKAGYPLDDEQQTRAIVGGHRSSPVQPVLGAAAGQQEHEDQASQPATHGGAALGLAASIERLKAAEAAAHAAYERETNVLQKSNLLKQWVLISEQLRKLEESNPEIDELNKKSVRLDELQPALSELFLTLRQDLETLPTRLAEQLQGKDVVEARQVIGGEVQRIIKGLYDCQYLGEE